MADRPTTAPLPIVALPPDWKQQLARAADADTYSTLCCLVESWRTDQLERREWAAGSPEPDDVAFLYDAYEMSFVRLTDGWHPVLDACSAIPAGRRRCVGIPWQNLKFPVADQPEVQRG
jgi:hypothetical protein